MVNIIKYDDIQTVGEFWKFNIITLVQRYKLMLRNYPYKTGPESDHINLLSILDMCMDTGMIFTEDEINIFVLEK